MMIIRARQRLSSVFVVTTLLVIATTTISAVVYPFNSPVFGIAISPDASVLVADAGTGVFEIRKGEHSLVAQLPGVTDIAPIGRGDMFAITSHAFGGEGKLYRVSRGSKREIADLFAFESRVNPDGGIIDTNPFDVEALTGGGALVADAAANALLIVDARGNIDWVATLPNEIISTAHAKALYGCPPGPSAVCDNATWPAEGVATSVAVGPDGAYYVGELKGIPAGKGTSRIWRIEPGSRHVKCSSTTPSPGCKMVATGFTSIVDLTFGPRGRLYVVEMDEESWVAMQLGKGTGGTVNACDTQTWQCNQIKTGLLMLSAAAVDGDGKVYAVTKSLIPNQVDISVVN